MAEPPYRAYRGQNGAYGHQDQHSSSGDPLAELARLIGSQNDPFSQQPRPASRSDGAARQPIPYARDPRGASGYDQYPKPVPSPGAQHDPQQGQQYADPRYGSPPFAAGQGYGSDPYYRDDEQDEDSYEEEAPARRRGGLLTAAAVLALVLIGVAGAFAYRAVFATGSPGQPPVIRADTTPNKIVPASSGEQSKQIYDRVGDKGQPERLLTREEKPVDVGDNLKSAQRMMSLPGATGSTPVNPIAAPAAPQLPQNTSSLVSTGAPLVPSTAPKRVKTVTIRPDGPDAEPPLVGRPATAPVAEALSPAPAAPPHAAAQPAPVRTAAPRTATPRVQNPAVTGVNAPMSLSPAANAASASERAPVMRTASASQSVPVVSSGSGYTVQISSQRSEADAHSAFRSLQSRYPGVLSGYQPLIRRADLGEKGVYYRVQVGPFASDQATSLCSRLQNAGGQCVVQRN